MPQPPQQLRRNPAQRPQPPQQQFQAAPPQQAAQDQDPDEQSFGQEQYAQDDQSGEDELPDVFNLADVPDQPAFEAIPAGRYNATIDSVEYGRSQSSGDPMLTFFLRVHVEGQEGTRDVPMRLYNSFGERSISRTKRQLEQLLPGHDFSNFQPNEADGLLAGVEVIAQVRVRSNPPNHQYPGKQNNIQALSLPAAGEGRDGFLS